MEKVIGKIVWLISILIVLFLPIIASAIPTEQWNKTFGGTNLDFGGFVVQTSDGGYILAGSTQSYGAGNGDLWLIKTDVNGNEQWNKTFGGTNTDTGGNVTVTQTSDGGYILAGSTFSYGAGFYDIWLIKTDADGNMIWNRTFGGTNSDIAYSVQQTSDGYILAGSTASYGGKSDNDAWLIKTDANGNQQWNKTFGGLNSDFAFSVQRTSDGYILAGSTASYGAGGFDAWLIKTDAYGNEQWNRTFGGTSSDSGRNVEQVSDGGFILVGSTASYGAGNGDLWLIKTDVNGNEQWNKTFGGISSDSSGFVIQTSDGGYVLVGSTQSYGAGSTDAWLIKTDASGNEQWNYTFGGTSSDSGRNVEQTSDGGFIIAGETRSYGAGNGDLWLIKLLGEVSNSIGYSATVATGQNTFVQSSNGTFGLLLKGQTKTINNSVVLNNTGDLSAKVEARFNDSRSGVFGLVSGANVLNATNFALGIPSVLQPLSSLGVDVQVAVAPPGVTALDARLGVPSDAVAGDYGGTVILTFSNSV